MPVMATAGDIRAALTNGDVDRAFAAFLTYSDDVQTESDNGTLSDSARDEYEILRSVFRPLYALHDEYIGKVGAGEMAREAFRMLQWLEEGENRDLAAKWKIRTAVCARVETLFADVVRRPIPDDVRALM